MIEKDRRPLRQVGGEVRRNGDEALSSLLARAWERASREDSDVLTHGFHSWPARMHWAIARTVIEALRPRFVLDPFCGSGTVLVEAMVAGAESIGVDLNPLAQRVAAVRSEVRDAEGRERFVQAAHAVAARSEARVRGRVPIRVDLPKEETRWYPPHVLKELGGLREEIRAIEGFDDRRALAMVFSSIVVKVSKQRADTSEREVERRIRKGLTTELFLRKATELAERWAELEAVAKGPPPDLIEGDARELPNLLSGRRADLILSSPPYGGTYDYADHHARRIAWLELDDHALRRHELGSRRSLAQEDGVGCWERDVDAMLWAMRASLRPEGSIVLVIGDADIEGQRVDALPQIRRIAPDHGLMALAAASQPRADWRGAAPREEHLVLLRYA